MSILGTRIKKLREHEGIQQIDFAKKIGVSNVVLSRYESGERKPDYDVLQKIADFFGVTTDYLLGRTEHHTTIEAKAGEDKSLSKIATEFPDIDLMFRDMESLTAEEMKEVYDYIKFKKNQKGN
ncbi:helix-turn-helix domain-containing protein [Sporosarcina sp. Te-1]|uniref:helix-turn-helix domain-containing protein n=1 Tax=Sporosarcina sp. Te-1 TaxID=2818390 RepID=UPI001A9F285A|nr:helix-turn-helix transcriptional regulator [Sporosarcina sp. Te-1]QTD41945.1 helix-turn-helix domain-containing protein [Sporosarcina sp. Te-1]